MKVKFLVKVMLVAAGMTGLLAGCDSINIPEPSGSVITGERARELYALSGTAILLDVRTQEEFDDHHIEGSILIPYDELESRLSELPDKNEIIIVFCRAGRRSAISAELLVAHGYTNVYDMQIVGHWG